MKCYTGYVVGKDETNPISVWIPAKNVGNAKMGTNRGFGTNAGNMSLLDLSYARMNAELCYMTCPLGSKSSYRFDDRNGYATVEDHLTTLDSNTVRNVKNLDSDAPRTSTPGEGDMFMFPHANPAENWLETYVAADSGGTELVNYDNAPGGEYCTLPIGTKVIVIYPDDKGTGYIIAQIPYLDEMSKLIGNISE
jgi:hypothetical protein